MSGFLAARSVLRMPVRGKALANWARPSIDELGVPTASWKQVKAAHIIINGTITENLVRLSLKRMKIAITV